MVKWLCEVPTSSKIVVKHFDFYKVKIVLLPWFVFFLTKYMLILKRKKKYKKE